MRCVLGASCLILAIVLVGCGPSSGSVDRDGDGATDDADCDDLDPAIHPGAPEWCDALDRNCDGDPTAGAIDADLYFADVDGDGFGDPDAPIRACALPPAAAIDATDCDDGDADVRPTAIETPSDGVDDNCDGVDACTDLNCDGLPDIAIPSYRDDLDFAVLQPARLLSGPGGWALEPTPLAMTGVRGAAVADLDHDGYQDIVHASDWDGASYSVNSVVYWGGPTGHGALDRTDLPTVGAYQPCIGDLNGDGWEEVVFPSFFDGDYFTSSYVYWNRDGAFVPADRTVLPTIGAEHCAIGQLNGDAFPDLVFASVHDVDYATTSYVYWGGAAGFDAAHRTELPTVGAEESTIADVDGDGDLDLVFWAWSDGDYVNSATYIYWNSPAGFSLANRTALDSMGARRGAIADLDGDGHNEVIVPGFCNGDWSQMAYSYIYWGNPANSYSNASRTSLGLQGVVTVTVDDIDQDGHLDLLLVSHREGDATSPSAIFWGRPDGTFNDLNRTELHGNHPFLGAGVIDFDHDGWKDVFLPAYYSNGWGAQAFSRIYWGGPDGPQPADYDEWPTRGAWSPVIVGR